MWLQQRRKRHEPGNSSIQLFVLVLAGLLPAVGQTAERDLGADPRVEQVGNDFEALMLGHLYRQMSEAQGFMDEGRDNPFKPSPAEKIFRAMREDEMVKRIAVTRPLGVGDMVVRQLQGRGGVPRGARIERRNEAAPVTAKPGG